MNRPKVHKVVVSDPVTTGQNVSVPQYEITVDADITDRNGEFKHVVETVQFPNILAEMSNPWLKEHLVALILRALKTKYNVIPDVGEAGP